MLRLLVAAPAAFLPRQSPATPGRTLRFENDIASLALHVPKVVIITHHKSGTVAAQDLIGDLCWPDGYAGHWNPASWMSVGKSLCEDDGVHFFQGGLQYPLQWPLTTATVVHFIRKPVDMVVSGYLYHRRCSEPLFTHLPMPLWALRPDAMLWMGGNATREAILRELDPLQLRHANASYCELLQQATPEQGIAAETLRTLSASDGVGSMLHDASVLHSLNSSQRLSQLLSICDSDIVQTYSEQANATWRQLAIDLGMIGPIHVHFDPSHSTRDDGFPQNVSVEELTAMAARELEQRRPSALAFECISQL